jgi:hypothetical protein
LAGGFPKCKKGTGSELFIGKAWLFTDKGDGFTSALGKVKYPPSLKV